MAKSKIFVSFILLFSFLLSSHVLAHELPETSLEKQNYDEGKVFKEQNPTSSYDLERKMRSGSSHFVRQGYKTPSLEETGKGTLSKDIVEVDKLGLENGKWYIDVGFGDGNNRGSNGIGGGSRGSNGGMRSSMGGGGGGQRDVYGGGGGQRDVYGGGGQRDVYGGGGGGQEDFYSGGGGDMWAGDFPSNNDMWGGDPIYDSYDFFPEPMNYKDASMMRYHNMQKLSEFDGGSFRHKSQAKKFGMKNGGKVHYGGVPRMEDIGEEKRN